MAPQPHNPFGGFPMRGAAPRFDAARYRSAGASQEEADELAELFEALTEDEQRQAASYADSASTTDLREFLDRWRSGETEQGYDYDVAGSKIDDIEAWVGDDADRAAYVAQVEHERGDKARSTLIASMGKVTAAAEQAEADRLAAEAEQRAQEQAGPDTAQPPSTEPLTDEELAAAREAGIDVEDDEISPADVRTRLAVGDGAEQPPAPGAAPQPAERPDPSDPTGEPIPNPGVAYETQANPGPDGTADGSDVDTSGQHAGDGTVSGYGTAGAPSTAGTGGGTADSS